MTTFPHLTFHAGTLRVPAGETRLTPNQAAVLAQELAAWAEAQRRATKAAMQKMGAAKRKATEPLPLKQSP